MFRKLAKKLFIFRKVARKPSFQKNKQTNKQTKKQDTKLSLCSKLNHDVNSRDSQLVEFVVVVLFVCLFVF